MCKVIYSYVGGAFTDGIGWRWCFYINLPIGAIALVVIFYGMRKLHKPKHRPSIDYAGTVLIIAAVVCFLLPLMWGGQDYAWDSAIVISLFIVGGVLLATFIVVEMKFVESPIIPMRLFKVRNFTICTIINFFAGFQLFLISYFLPIWFQTVRGESATQSGLQSIATSFGLIIASMLTGGLVTKFGHYYTYMPVGHAIEILGLGLISTFDKGSGQAQFIIFMGLTGLGFGMYFQVVTLVAQNAVDIKEIATATATVQFFRTIGAVFGVTYGGLYLNQYISSHIMKTMDIKQLYIDAISHIFLYGIPFAGVGFIVSFLIKPEPLKTTNEGGNYE